VLTVFSLVFYAWGEPVWVLAMLFSTAVNYVCARRIASTENSRRRKLQLTVGVIASIAFLVYFKYAAFFANSFAALFGMGEVMKEPGLPIGISFYTFQILTYTIDLYRGKTEVQKSPFKLLLYISCFPQLIAGPIVQYKDVALQLDERNVSPADFAEGMARFVKGLGKKVLLANICGAMINELPVCGTGGQVSLAAAWLLSLLYALQLYFDFSAYSDMAIGPGRTLGFTYKENFVYPYVSCSFGEFWTRWHISLTSFFREYVYFPLGGNRRGLPRTLLNMGIVWMLTGLWHGASWNFVLWGMFNFVMLIAERYVLKNVLVHIPKIIRWVLTMAFVLLAASLFYFTDLSALGQQLGAMFGAGGMLIDPITIKVLKTYSVFPLIALVLSLPVVPWISEHLPRRLTETLRPVLVIVVFVYSVMFLVGDSYNPFIYFRF